MVKAAAVVILVAVPMAASAFCGRGHPDVARELKDSRLVFVGKVLGATEWSHDGGFPDGTLYSVEVTDLLKGAGPSLVTLYSENSSGRFPMETGASYVIFAYEGAFEFRTSPEFAVDNCGNSGSLAEPRAQDVLAQVRRLTHAPRTAAQPAAPADRGRVRSDTGQSK
jgi:hypothetical protein